MIFRNFKKFIKFSVEIKIGKAFPFRSLLRLAFFYLFPDSIITKEGFRMFLNKNDIAVSGELALKKTWEETETELIKRELKKGDVFLDIGANIGYYTLLASKIVGDKGRVFSVEPDPENFALLKKNVEVNNCKNVTLIEAAASDISGKIKLFLSDLNMGDHQTYDSGTGRNAIEIEAIRIDEYFNKISCPKIDLVKMDIEGAEGDALRGMSGLFEKGIIKKIISEFFPRVLRDNNFDPDEYLKMLQARGFHILKINEADSTITEINQMSAESICGQDEYVNLFCRRQ